MTRTTRHIEETRRKYIKYKMKEIKKAKKRGNDSKARRHARELSQYLGTGTDDMPIERMLE